MCRLAEREIMKLAKEKEVEIQHVHRRVLGQLTKPSVHEVSGSFAFTPPIKKAHV